MNHNLPEMNTQYLNEIKKIGGVPHDENMHQNKDQFDPNELATGKAQGKGVGAEYLRTELKSVENRGVPAATHQPAANDNRAVMTRNPLYM